MSFELLPDEIILYIFTILDDVNDTLNGRLVNKILAQLGIHDNIWLPLLKITYPDAPIKFSAFQTYCHHTTPIYITADTLNRYEGDIIIRTGYNLGELAAKTLDYMHPLNIRDIINDGIYDNDGNKIVLSDIYENEIENLDNSDDEYLEHLCDLESKTIDMHYELNTPLTIISKEFCRRKEAELLERINTTKGNIYLADNAVITRLKL